MDPYPYGGFPNAPNDQYQDNSSYYASVSPTNPYQQYPRQVAYPAQYGDPRQWAQTPARQVVHPTHFQSPGVPVSAYSTNPAGSQWPPMRTELDVESPREKIRRTRTACEECRKRKQRCDGNQPCQPCTEQRTECQYRDAQPSKKDARMERMLDLAERYQNDLASMSNNLDSIGETLGRIDRRLESDSNRRSGYQPGGQNSPYQSAPQYPRAPSSAVPRDWSERRDNAAEHHSKRRRR